MNARSFAAAAALLILVTLMACTPASEGSEDASDSPKPSSSPSSTVVPEDTASPTPSPAATKGVALPTDCRAILSDAILAQLEGIPLNDAAFGPSGIGEDGTLTCIWGDPAADTTSLITTISGMNRGPALDILNALVDKEGFSCFAPDGGTRCEKTWPNKTYPVTDGRTLFWKDDVLIDTHYSNLAPDGYTSSIVESLFG